MTSKKVEQRSKLSSVHIAIYKRSSLNSRLHVGFSSVMKKCLFFNVQRRLFPLIFHNGTSKYPVEKEDAGFASHESSLIRVSE